MKDKLLDEVVIFVKATCRTRARAMVEVVVHVPVPDDVNDIVIQLLQQES